MFRAIQRNPASYVTASVTIATGIGAVVAMFSIFSAVVLHPMDVERPEQLVSIQATNPRITNVPTSLSWIRFDNSLRHARSFSHIAAWDYDSVALSTGDAAPEELNVLRVSSDFFSVLGIAPTVGRAFLPSDDVPNGPDVCVLSHELWVTRFGKSQMIGRTISLNGRPVEVVGILPPQFTAPWTNQQLFLPRLFETSTMLPENIQGGSSYLAVIGRLRPDVTLDQAQSELNGLASEYSSRFAGRTDAANRTAVTPFVETLVGNWRQTMLILLSAVAAVLLVACANASTLFLGRLLARQRETAVRRALGASRARIIWQFLLESLALSSIAGVAGLAIAWGLVQAVAVFLGSALPQADGVSLDATALFVALLVVGVAAVLVGVIPAWYVTRPVMTPLLTFARGDVATPSGSRVRAALVLSEVALSCMLLIGAALLVTSLIRLQQDDPGFDLAGIAAGNVTLPQGRYPDGDRQALFVTTVVDRLKASAGVREGAAVFGLPLGTGFSWHQYVVAGQPIPPPSERQRAGIRLVTEGYFELMGIRLKAGRLFNDRDRAGAPNVCLINESLAKRFGGNPLGQAILRGRNADLRYEIVGVVQDVRSYGLQQPAVDEVYYPLRQLPWPQFSLVARTDDDPLTLRRAVENAIGQVDPALPFTGFASMQQLFEQSAGSERSMALITLVFATIAMFMALVGLYAVLAQSVASRTTDIGIRIALGADRGRVIRLILQSGMTIVALGIGLGMIAAVLGARYLTTQLYAVDARDPVIFCGVAAAFGAVALLACLAPSWRAAKLDPIDALRKV
jgi:putative ABC transport system permease protein